MKPRRPTKENTSNMTTVRLGVAPSTTMIPRDAHGLMVTYYVRYAPSQNFAELDDPTLEPDWQEINWYGEAGDITLLGRNPEQGIVELEGV
jgi:hypothetical protein